MTFLCTLGGSGHADDHPSDVDVVSKATVRDLTHCVAQEITHQVLSDVAQGVTHKVLSDIAQGITHQVLSDTN